MRPLLIGLTLLLACGCAATGVPPQLALCGPLYPPHLIAGCQLWAEKRKDLTTLREIR